MTNPSGINVVGPRILVLPTAVENKTASGIILSTEDVNERERMAATTGTVVDTGSGAYEGYDVPWCKVGDKITFAKYAGMLYRGRGGIEYRVMKDEDVTSVLDADINIVDMHLAKGLQA